MSYPTSFLILNLQNDLCHEEGVYAKQGLTFKQKEEIIPPLLKALSFCKEKKIPIIASCLTVLVDLEKKAMGIQNILELRPFLKTEGFRENSWGHDLLEEIPEVDYKIRQWSLSPFYQTELDRYLLALGSKEIVLTGFTTNSTVETCAREAIERGLKTITLTDCVASYSESLHEASLTNLASFGKIMTSQEWMSQKGAS